MKLLYQDGNQKPSKTCRKGSPQRSVLGPTFWNVVLDSFLECNIPDNIGIIAYADDIALVAKSNTTLRLK